jgi:hypothetical protein
MLFPPQLRLSSASAPPHTPSTPSLDKVADGTLARDDLEANSVIKKQDNPYTLAIFDLLKKDNQGRATFQSFLSMIKMFRPETPMDAKIKAVFRILVQTVPNSKKPVLTAKHFEAMVRKVAPDASSSEVQSQIKHLCSDMKIKPDNLEVDQKTFATYIKTQPQLIEALKDPLQMANTA